MHETVDEGMAQVLRAKTPAERLAIVDAIWESVTEIMRQRVRRLHPDWNERQIALEAGRKLSYEAD